MQCYVLFCTKERIICVRKQKNRNYRELLPRHRRVSRTPARYTSGNLNSVAFAHSQKVTTNDNLTALPICNVLDEKRQGKSRINYLRAFRTTSAAAKRDWRTLARVWQHRFSPAHIDRSASSRPRAHALRVTGFTPALRSPRHPRCSRFRGAFGGTKRLSAASAIFWRKSTICLARHCGLHIHEIFRLDTATAQRAIKTGQLTIKGNGGKI